MAKAESQISRRCNLVLQLPGARHPDPYIKGIREAFLHPIVRCTPIDEDLVDWLDQNFHVNERNLQWYEAKGRIQLSYQEILQGAVFCRPRWITTLNFGQRFLARTDVTMPNRIDIEVHSRKRLVHGGEWVVFRLDAIEWERLRGQCRPVKSADRIRDY